MKLHGSMPENLHAAINSVIRLRGHSIYPETLEYWQRLLSFARDHVETSARRDTLLTKRLADQLEQTLSSYCGVPTSPKEADAQ
jgi:hypothetical protein